MKGIRYIAMAALALAVTSCAQPETPKVTDDWAPIIGKVELSDVAGTTDGIPLSAEVYDNVGVTTVEFYVGSEKVGAVDAGGAKRGTYSVMVSNSLAFSCKQARVVAHDAAGYESYGWTSMRCP